MNNVDQLNSIDGATYQSLLPLPCALNLAPFLLLNPVYQTQNLDKG